MDPNYLHAQHVPQRSLIVWGRAIRLVVGGGCRGRGSHRSDCGGVGVTRKVSAFLSFPLAAFLRISTAKIEKCQETF